MCETRFYKFPSARKGLTYPLRLKEVVQLSETEEGRIDLGNAGAGLV